MHIATSLKTDKKGDSSNFESVNDKGCSTSETLAEGKDDDSEDYVFLVCEELALTKYYLSTCRVKYDSSSVRITSSGGIAPGARRTKGVSHIRPSSSRLGD